MQRSRRPMPSRRQYAALVLLAVGLAAVLNGSWLFPNEGERRYTYERTELGIENGTLEPQRAPDRRYDEYHHLDGVACDHGPATRDCAVDRHLREAGPVTVATPDAFVQGPDYTRLEDAYYRRIAATNGPQVSLELERVDPTTVRADLATTAPAAPPEAVEAAPPGYRAVATGDSVTASDPPHEADLGTVYSQDGVYYTAVLTGTTRLDRPLVSPAFRSFLSFAGAVLLIAAVVLLPAERDAPERHLGLR